MHNSGPPLGVLCVAATLLQHGVSARLINLDKLFYDYIKIIDKSDYADFLAFIIDHIELGTADIFGLSSICSSYPLTISLALEIKKRRPSAKLILGGPQASSVDVPTLDEFQFVDAVVRGEAENSFPVLLEVLSGDRPSLPLDKIEGITFRRGKLVIRTNDAPPIKDLDRLPLPAFDLDPCINDYQVLPLEAGRGCPFNCTFCSTSKFFKRRFRLKSPHKIIQEMQWLNDRYDVKNFLLIHDMFTANTKSVASFCRALLDYGRDFTWTCSARTDCIDDSLIDLMAQAGCRGIFFGIESGSVRMQEIINKRLDLQDAIKRIEHSDRCGVRTGVSLITGFPDENKQDLANTINFVTDLLRFDNVEPQLALLAPLAGSDLYNKYRGNLVFDSMFSDMSQQGFEQPAFVDLIRSHENVFPDFFAIPTDDVPRAYFTEVRDFVTGLHFWFRWLPVILLDHMGDLLSVFENWAKWQKRMALSDSGPRANKRRYYSEKKFALDFCEFVDATYSDSLVGNAAISAVTRVEKAIIDRAAPAIPDDEDDADSTLFSMASYPFKPADVKLVRVPIDYQSIIGKLRVRQDWSDVFLREETIVLRTNKEKASDIEVRRLSPLSEEILTLCNGQETVREIADKMAMKHIELFGLPPTKVCVFTLLQMYKEGIVRMSPKPCSQRSQRSQRSPDGADLAEHNPGSFPVNPESAGLPGTFA